MAISSCCHALDYIVVDSIDTAQECVNFLKRQNIGVATFIGLDKVGIHNNLPIIEFLSAKCFFILNSSFFFMVTQ